MTDLSEPTEQTLFEQVAGFIETARAQVVRSVNTAMVQAFWNIGRRIVEVEQGGQTRAGYGEALMNRLAERLTKQFGRGFGVANLRRMRLFFLAFSTGSALPRSDTEGIRSTALIEFEVGSHFPPALSWSHYVALIRIVNPLARQFYEIEAAKESWSVRELERQIASLLFERLARNRNPAQVLALAQEGQRVQAPRDVLKDPFVLEFLDLGERPHWQERDLEQAIIHRLEAFLMELGKGFCFVARQKRLTLEGDHFYVDLVFYNRLLRCFVLVDLKLGKLTHHDLGQMQMYVHFYDRFHREAWEAPTVGIVLCSDKNDAMVRITLPADNAQIHAGTYQLHLPSEAELRAELVREREEIEQDLRLHAPEGE